MSKRVRWECPNELHPGVLGPTRPRRDNIVRYCLPCSEAAGVLIERVAPALDRKRADAKAAAERKRLSKQERERDKARSQRVLAVREPDGSIGEVDIRATLEKMIRLPVLRDHAERSCPYIQLQAPKVTLRRSRNKPYTSGHAPYYSWEFTVTAAADPERIEFEETLLHELIHLLLPGAHHSNRYRSVLVQAAREWWPGIETSPDGGESYELDRRIVRDASLREGA